MTAAVGALVLLAALGAAAYAGDDPPLPAAAPSMIESPPAVAAHADDSELPARPTFTTPAVPPIDSSGNDAMLMSPTETQEIPQAMPPETPVAVLPPYTVPSSSDLHNYMNDDPDLAGGIGSARDFVAQGEETSPIGVEVREWRRRLKTGEELDGLLILKVGQDSAAAKAGLRPYKDGAHHVLEAMAIGAAIFPPAILATIVALPMIEYTEMGESYDMIIGIDGSRVTNFLDFEERMRNVQPGELVYFNLVRNGKRIQLVVPVPALSTSATN